MRSRPRRRRFITAAALANLCIPLGSSRAGAETLGRAIAIFDRQEVATLTLLAGVACFAVLTTVVLIRTRRHAGRNYAGRDEAAALQAEVDRFKQLLLSDPQVLVAWAAADDKPEILGDTALIVPGTMPERVLAFGAWLEPAAAQR
ncbi:MAG: two-component sensor histidine kinase, partial [Pseudolabrys sp.]|nr:two-component sensor histidine kinase [Pseudolabrys sp.]